ncbi:DUF6434 domain-containing protein [Corallococcus sp. bb12-1]|uniref:DUF6434 domain-containing protein n=1 Tax=Corallococcus sp. bb12-1 TaxID=2996784 RepID=UPI002270219A|nr:DUF6434 domain-containing protein [Corallococcus sp. bb12-1]MCY1042396.1 DUF6434 domain-containing protein [Corallococcus sp. bb12-1]
MSQAEREERGRLTRQTSVKDFRDFYWLKEELLVFCREQDLSTVGGKREVAERIEHYLRTGQHLAPQVSREKETDAAWRVNNASSQEFSLKTQAPKGFRCTQEIRVFFEQHLGKTFRFTVTLQRFIKDHPGVTFEEIMKEWTRQESTKKAGEWRPEIAPQFEFNRFTRDFFADPLNKGKTRQDCQEAWKRTREGRGEKKYVPNET